MPGMRVEIGEYFPIAQNRTRYVPARIQFGNQAPPPAIEVVTTDGQNRWLGLGDRVQYQHENKIRTAQFMPRVVALPFALFLEKFGIDYYEGTQNPKEYASKVRILTGQTTQPSDLITISMNQPLRQNGYTFYQSSYIPEDPRPTTSVFSVGNDPGIVLKYGGSIILILGTILLFYRRTLRKV
jgi:hypothetical protein